MIGRGRVFHGESISEKQCPSRLIRRRQAVKLNSGFHPAADGLNVGARIMRVAWIAGVVIIVLAGATVLLPRVIPVPCERKVGEIREEGQMLRFKVPPSRNLLYGDKYHLSLAIPSKGGRIVAEGRITDASGSQVARISVPHGAVRTNWLDGEGFDGYVAAWSAPLEAGQVCTLQLRRFDSDEEVSVWVTGFNLE